MAVINVIASIAKQSRAKITILDCRVRLSAFLTMTLLCFFFAVTAHAACTNPAGDEGAIIYNSTENVPQVCSNTSWVALGIINPAAGGAGCTNPVAAEGAIIYNADIYKPQYCDGDNWVEMIGTASSGGGGGGCTPDPACTNVGDVCSGDGSGGGNPKFAGCICYYDSNSADDGNCKALYVTQANQSTASQWKNATGTNDISTDSTEDGKFNDGQVPNSATFPAFKLCKDLTDGGYTDWYLPARTELNVLRSNRVTITGFTTSSYWSSVEFSTVDGWVQYFSDGSFANRSKTDSHDVRCVRRD